MSEVMVQEIVAGSVVEFFEAKEVICGVCTAVKGTRLAILTENNREVSLAQSRVIHTGDQPLNLKLSRDALVQKLTAIAAMRRSLMKDVNLEELWSLLQSEEEGFDASELAGFVFSGIVADHHISAVQRVLFQDRLFFQFKDGKFYARDPEKVEQRRLEIQREEEKEAEVEQASQWLSVVWTRKGRPPAFGAQDRLVESLKSFCLFGAESADQAFVKEIFKRAHIPPQPQSAFRLLVRLGIWTENENLYLHEQNISADFPKAVEELALQLSRSGPLAHWEQSRRRDLRSLNVFTIDSAMTRDYDDALSLEVLGEDSYEVGIHIADAAELIGKDDPLDGEAQARASSIYLPDGRIAMLPPSISEGLCSLRAGEDRLALSFLIRMNAEGVMMGHDIVPSVIKVRAQMTYEEVNQRVNTDEPLRILHALAVKLREQRLARGAIILPLPEIQVHVKPGGMIQLSRYEKETPSQIMVSEWMIAANALAALYLSEHHIPALYRSQGECRPETDFTQSDHPLFHIYRQRRLFARAELDVEPRAHCSLAVPHYTTVTSPIRRYVDLVVQRQLKQALAQEPSLYTVDELRQLLARLGSIQSKIVLIQRKWTRYWILKYMEQEDIETLNALVLEQNERFAHVLLPDFLIETNVPLTNGNRLQAGEMVRVKVERLNPREDILRVQLQ